MTRQNPVVTVVDSDEAVREALVSLIRSAGWMARAFASAWEFLACPRVLIPGCLVADMTLPDLDGLTLQQRVAERREMPIIFMTRDFDVLTTVRAMKAGAFELMTKPFREDAMLLAIAHRGRVMLKMQARSLAELVTIAARLDSPARAGRMANSTSRHSARWQADYNERPEAHRERSLY